MTISNFLFSRNTFLRDIFTRESVSDKINKDKRNVNKLAIHLAWISNTSSHHGMNKLLPAKLSKLQEMTSNTEQNANEIIGLAKELRKTYARHNESTFKNALRTSCSVTENNITDQKLAITEELCNIAEAIEKNRTYTTILELKQK